MPLRVATSAFPVSAAIASNARFVRRHIEEAAEAGAQVVHFPESALSGYAGADVDSYEGYDWATLRAHSQDIQQAAREAGVAVILGSTHELSGGRKPHNSVYVIAADGELVDRYDKRFCAGPATADAEELASWTSGTHPCVFDLHGVRCGVLICHEYRYPELYRQYKQMGVQLVFQSFYAGNLGPERWQAMNEATGPENLRLNCMAGTLPGITMPATLIARAANNHLWISASNTSAAQSCWGSLFVRPDGVITGRVIRNRTGLLIKDVDPAAGYYDSTVAWRDRAIAGVFYSGSVEGLEDDPRSQDRGSF